MNKIENKTYYQVLLELSLIGDKYVFGFINISHVPYKKFEEILKDKITDERYLFDNNTAYLIDEKVYKKHKKFLDSEIPIRFDFKLFQYSISLASLESEEYIKDYYEEMPSYFDENNASS